MRRFEVNELLGRHGETGSILRSVRRHGLLGWCLFGVAAVLLLVLSAAYSLIPRPVLVVDRTGRVRGQITWRRSVVSRREMLDDSETFVSDLLSMNSATVFDEYAHALNMMSPALRARILAETRRNEYLAKIVAAHLTSWVTFATGDQAPQILKTAGNRAWVQLSGQVIADGAQVRRSAPFDLMLGIRRVPRTTANTSGIEVDSVRTE
ncbi:MAG: hypothetical protein ACYCQK_08010 [Acidiferrobacteraceae bacterium]